MNPFDLPGCTFIGHVKAANVNGGKPVPLFVPCPPSGNMSINTLEGWNASADKQNRRSFIKAHGRDPADDNEVWRWICAINNR